MKDSILKKVIIILISICFILALMTIKSNAASLSIKTSKSSVSPGETFTVTVTLSNGAGYVTSGGQTQWLDNSSFSYTKTAGSSGSVSITASGIAADYTTEQDESVYASETVKIVQPTSNEKPTTTTKKPTTTTKPVEEKVKSKNSALSALSITEGAITPEFNKDVKEYALTVPNEITTVNVTATPEDSKAKATVEGNTDLKEGENTVAVKVTAEDGSTTNYTIKVTRSRAKLSLQSLVIKYENQEGQVIEIPLNPEFKFDVTEYSLQDLEYWVNKLDIEATANLEGATIDIQGAENLQTGENTITITLKIPQEGEVPEGEEPKEETIVYTIKVNKEKEPTLLGKISNWFKGIFGGVTTWYNSNQGKVILYALGVCIIALIGLSIYIVVDYNKYKDVIAKFKKVKEINDLDKENNIIEEISQNKNTETIVETNEEDKKNNKGKHF